MILEETLKARSHDESTAPPPDVALELLSFLREELPMGGLAAEQRLRRMLPLVMEWCFGHLAPDPSSGLAGFSPEESVCTMQQKVFARFQRVLVISFRSGKNAGFFDGIRPRL